MQNTIHNAFRDEQAPARLCRGEVIRGVLPSSGEVADYHPDSCTRALSMFSIQLRVRLHRWSADEGGDDNFQSMCLAFRIWMHHTRTHTHT